MNLHDPGAQPASPEQYPQFVREVELRLQQAIRAGAGGVLGDAAAQLCFAGAAKRARPRLVWLFAHCLATPPATGALVDVAAAAELLHSGSLLHDDVVDAGRLRRGRPTANAQWGNLVAVLSGDLLLTAALDLLRGYNPAVLHGAVQTVAAMTRAAIAEIEARGQLDLPLACWRATAAGKTGALFAWCGRAVAELADDEQCARRLTRCGLGLGIAFQLSDDLLDLIGDGGKHRYADLRNREASFPTLLAASMSPDLRSAVQQLWDRGCPADELQRVGQQILASGAVSRAVQQLDDELAAALAPLAQQEDRPGARELVEWAAQLRGRIPPAPDPRRSVAPSGSAEQRPRS